MKSLRKKQRKTPKEVQEMRHFDNNTVNVVCPSQNVIHDHTKKLKIGDILNPRTREVDLNGWWVNSGSWGTDKHAFCLDSIKLIVGHPVFRIIKGRL
jgi:hypothetical protein